MPKIFFVGEAEDFFFYLPMDTAWFIASQSEEIETENGSPCKSMADSFQCMTKPPTIL